MKALKIYTLISLFMIMMISKGQAQNQEYTVPLSNPGKTGKLYAKVHTGSIKVEGHNGKDVIITVVSSKSGDHDHGGKNGLKRVANVATPFEIVELNNEVRIQGTGNKRISFEIKVPKKFSLQLNTHHEGYIEVNGVEGEIEVDGHHEDIVLKDVGGSVIADTHHGRILVSFSSIKPGVPMAFSTYHGDIDVTFPSTINGAVKVKTTKGDIYTDYEMDLKVESSTVKSAGSSGTKIEVGGWLKGNIGSGGSEMLFSTYHGDIIIRKQ